MRHLLCFLAVFCLLPLSAGAQTAPSVTVQPAGVTVIKGGPVTLTAAGSGSPAPAWQWYRNSVAIPGATAATLTIPAASLPDHGNYFARLSNASGSTDTTTVAVSVLYPGEGLRHRYSFTGNLNDTVGTAHAQLWAGTAQVTSPTVGASSLTFTQSSSHHLRLPPAGAGTAGLNVNTYDQLTVEMWCTMADHTGKFKLWEFGNSTSLTSTTATAATDYLYFCPRTTNTSGAATTLGMTDNSLTAERVITRTGRFMPQTNAHIVCVVDPLTGTQSMYLNGALAATSSSFGTGTLPKLSEIGTQYAFIGRALLNSSGAGSGSNFGFLNGSVDELRIYRVALRPQDVTANFTAGANSPPVAPAAISFAADPQSVTVTDPGVAVFTADVNGPKPLSVQWYRNGAPIPGANAVTHSTATVPADSGSIFFCRATSGALVQDSATATLTVIADTVRPVITGLSNSGTGTVTVRFSEPVSAATATALGNYSLSPAISFSSAVLAGDGRSVTFTTSTPLSYGTAYTLTVSGVTDISAAANVILPGSTRSFTALPFVLGSVGSPLVAPASDSSATGEYFLTSSGSLPQATADSYGFASESRTGDFDLRVRVASLGLTDMWARAGLMARNGSAAGDLLAAAVATPGPAGCFFMSRGTANAAPVQGGAYPVIFPHTWLRLRRVGNVFTGFASLDGTRWTQLASATVAMSSTVQVGVFASSGTDTATTAAFSNYGDATGAVITTEPLPFEPDGPSSRRSAITVTEIFYNPNSANGAGNLEFIEVHNTAGWTEDLSDWTLKGGIDYTFPPGTSILPGAYLVVAAAPADLQAATGLTNVLGPWTGSLSNEGEAFRLENEVGGTIAEVEYNDEAPWPVAAAGLGHSLALTHPSYGENDARAWSASDTPLGSPGRRDSWTSDPRRAVRISEFLANSEAPVTDFVELFNTSTVTVDLGGCRIGDGAVLGAGYLFPSPTILPARGYLALTEAQLGFSLGSDGERLWLMHPDGRILDAISYSGQDVNVSRDRELRELATPTPGASNSGPKDRPVVISEIMYNPLSGNQAEEYIELHNKSGSSVDVSGWRIGGGIGYDIPAGTSIAAGGYLVIARNQAMLLAKGYASLSAANVRGDFTGLLGNSGDRVSLRIPVAYTGVAGPGIAYATVDEVTYITGGEWGRWADGGGSSLELRDVRADNSLAASWADSIETAKAGWTTLSVNMLHDYKMPDATSGTNQAAANRVEFFLQGAGQCLVDDIEILDTANLNYVSNGGFESGLGTAPLAWTGQGDQKQIALQTSGAASGTNCLRLTASDRGDTGANRVRNALSTNGTTAATLPQNVSYTVRAKVRWLAGSRYFHLRTRGNGLELAGVLDIPATPGTPGAANSTAINAGPAISGATHWPVLPAASQAVVVTARLADPDGIAGASVDYRIDPSTTVNSVAMNDSGTGGDAFAADGVWSATIPGQASGALVAWKVSASDLSGSPASSVWPAPDPLLFPAALQAREAYVRFGETTQTGNFGTYRLWLSAATITEWNNREKNSNQPLPGTFVLGDFRVFHGIQSLYSGSPWHTGNFNGPTGTASTGANQCDYEVILSADNRLLGATDFVLQNQSGATNSCQDEFTAYWISRKLGLFAPNRRPVHLFVNGGRKGTIFEDAEQPSGESVEQYQRSATGGTLYKIEDWFEFDDAGSAQNYFNANLPQTSTTVNGVSGLKKMARYRWNWRVRSQADPNTYQPVYTLTDLMNAPIDASFVPDLEAQVDLHSWLGTIMAHHIVGNKDSYGYERGKNGYAFKAANDRWKAYLFDMDFSLAAAQDSATSNLFSVNADPNSSKDGQPETAKLFGIPGTKRVCWNILQEAAAGPLSGIATPLIDQRYADFLCNGVAAAAPTATKQYIVDRRNYILGQLPSASFAVSSSAPSGTDPSVLVVTGTSPVTVKDIVINGVVWPLLWTSDTQWTLNYAMRSGLNTLNISGVNRLGTTVATAPPVSATYSGSAAWAALRINEWMSDNQSVLADPADGAYDDWLELHNPTALPVDLTGWYLSDNPAQPAKFLVPAGFSIPANGFLRIWADNSTVQTAPGQLHTNFRLSNNGESILLSAPDLTLIDSVYFGTQAQNAANGRYPDGSSGIVDLTEPTAGAPNIAALWNDIVMTGSGYQVTFTSTPGRTYRLRSSDDLDVWTTVGANVTATGTSVTITDPAGITQPRRFYLVELLPQP